MRLIISAIGRLKDGGERDLYERYAKRLDQSGKAVSLGPLTLNEFPESKLASADLRKADEATRLLKSTANADVIVVLDEHGRQYSSVTFAQMLGGRRDNGAKAIAFMIGGADGHGDSVLSAATIKLSLGAMTLPHGLARVVLAEQLYRASTLLSGHPYHRA
jgi:23S rRNA (pseudouridine1915-N3)-methyltransferase